MKKIVCIIGMCVLYVFSFSPLFAQTSPESLLKIQDEDKDAPITPEEYSQEEFADWLYYVYRFGAVTVGSIPFSLLFSSVVYDVYKTSVESVDSGRFESKYLPLFFSGPDKPAYTDEEVQQLLWSTLAVSIGVSIIDLVIILVQRERKNTIENIFR